MLPKIPLRAPMGEREHSTRSGRHVAGQQSGAHDAYAVLKTESRPRQVRVMRTLWAVRWFAGFLQSRRQPHLVDGLRVIACFQHRRAIAFAFARSAYRPKYPFAAGLR